MQKREGVKLSKIMQYTQDDFFKENESNITKDGSTLIPPIYYQSLHEAFKNYFKTVKNNKNTYHFLLDFNNAETSSFDFHNLDSAVFTILGFHRFFELLLKDILRRIDPLLTVKFPENEKETIKFYNQGLSHEKMETVEFSKAFQRFKEAINYSDQNPDNLQYELVKNFLFLKNDDTLLRLATWRNRIMHNGNTFPNVYLLDYFVSQKIVPLIDAVIKAEVNTLKDYTPHYFRTLSGINIIEEITRIKIDYKDFKDENKRNELSEKILKLAHLKELGRAAYGLDISIKENISYNAPYYEGPVERNKRFAEQEKSHKAYCTTKQCPCCGFDTLVVYSKDFTNNFTGKKDFVSWFNCYTCTYSLKNNIWDPQYFGFSDEKLFATE